MPNRRYRIVLAFLGIVACLQTPALRAVEPGALEADTGYRGIWYKIAAKGVIKYSGGMATYPQQIRPFAIYSKAANKTFFVYGGRSKEKNELLHMISYYDHATGRVPRPRILLNKQTGDAHDNPTLSIDGDGYVWIFSNTHGPEKRSFIHRSTEPYSIDAFEKVSQLSLSYGDPWHLPGRGFFLLHNRYTDGRAVAFQTSPDGRTWSDSKLIAQMKGHYAISAPSPDRRRVGVAFNYHPRGLDTRTNLYYVETPDFGATWHTAGGEPLSIPLKDPHAPALVHDYEAEGLLVYLKDVQYDAAGQPILLYLTSKNHMPGPQFGPHQWRTAHWTGDAWRIRDAVQSDHNYDFGQLYVDANGWKLVAPTDPGPQPNMTGGEVVVWTSKDEGATWEKGKALTPGARFNHTYVRQPVDASPDFYALWADGHANAPSESRLYFTDKDGSAVWMLPTEMTEDFAKPVRADVAK